MKVAATFCPWLFRKKVEMTEDDWSALEQHLVDLKEESEVECDNIIPIRKAS